MVFRRVGQLERGPHVKYESRITVRNDAMSAVGGFRSTQ